MISKGSGWGWEDEEPPKRKVETMKLVDRKTWTKLMVSGAELRDGDYVDSQRKQPSFTAQVVAGWDVYIYKTDKGMGYKYSDGNVGSYSDPRLVEGNWFVVYRPPVEENEFGKVIP